MSKLLGVTMSPAAAFAQAPVGLQRTVRGYVSYAGRWLRANVEDVVRIEPSDRAAAPATVPALMPGLARWRASVEWRRAVTLARRWLLVALAVGASLQLVGLAAGAATTSRALWLIGPALLWAVGVAVGLRQHRPRVEDVARLLDHDLALAEVVSTALELEQRSSPDRAHPAPGGLPALVLAEGSAAVARSVGRARVASNSTWPERVVPAAFAVVVALLIALPSSGSGVPSRSGVARHGAATSTGSASARGAASASKRPAAGSAAPGAAASARRAAASTRSTAVRTRSGQSRGQTPAAPSRALTRGPSIDKSTAGSLPQRSAGVRSAGAPRGAGAGQPGAAAQAGTSPAAVGQASTRSRATGGVPRRASASPAAAGASSARGGRAGASHGPGQSAASASKASPALAARHGAARGESAGSARGSNVTGARRLAPGSVQVVTSLPIQTGYGRSIGSSVRTRSGPAVTGGHGPGRSATVTGPASAGGTIFSYIPPTPSLLSSFDQGPVLSYFGPFSLLLSATW
jgi:hypothetical protein